MPTKTRKTRTTRTTTSVATRIKNVYGNTYFVTKTTLREATPYGYKLKLIDLKVALQDALQDANESYYFNSTTVPYSYNGSTGDGSPYEARVRTDHKTYITIGCQRFNGKNAKVLLRATKKVKPLAKAATAGV